jgi:hypothetical protein
MNAPMKVAAIAQDCLDVAKHASLTRVLEQASIQNKGPVFGLMAGCAANEVAAFRQNVIDGLWEVALETGLVRLIGTTSVQGWIIAAFDEGGR